MATSSRSANEFICVHVDLVSDLVGVYTAAGLRTGMRDLLPAEKNCSAALAFSPMMALDSATLRSLFSICSKVSKHSLQA